MSVRLQGLGQTGKTCPKCGNESVFTKDHYGGFLNLFYKYTETYCAMGGTMGGFPGNCGYQIIEFKTKKK